MEHNGIYEIAKVHQHEIRNSAGRPRGLRRDSRPYAEAVRRIKAIASAAVALLA